MSNTFIRMASAVLIAASFFFCLVAAIFKSDHVVGSLIQMMFGFGVGAVVGVAVLLLRNPVVWFAGTLFLLFAAMGAILLNWPWAGVGAGVAAGDVLLLYIGWIQPHTAQPFNHVDYAKEQQKIYEEEKARAAGGQGPGAVGRS